MATLHVQCTDTPAFSAVVEVFQRGLNGQPDSLLHSTALAPGGVNVDLPAGAYVVVRAASDDQAKSIDNW